MRILRVTSSVNPASGGPTEGIRQITRILDDLGHVTEAAAFDRPGQDWFSQLSFKVHTFPPDAKIAAYKYAKGFVPWLRENASNYDAIIVHGIWHSMSPSTRRALKKSNVPYFVYPHGMLDPWFKKAYPLKHFIKQFYWRVTDYLTLRDANAVLFTCEQERVLAQDSYRPYKANEVVVNYGTAGPSGDPESQKELFFETYPALRYRRILLFLSRIHPKKGCDLLVDAFAEVADLDLELHLVMAGPDNVNWKDELIEKAENKGIADRITWPGMLSGDIKWGAFHAAEVFVLPSHQENFGIVVAEALACAKPVLTTFEVNIWREIEADGAGFIDSDDTEGTVRLLKKWLALSPEERKKMSNQASKTFGQRFEISQAAQSFLNVLADHGVNTSPEK